MNENFMSWLFVEDEENSFAPPKIDSHKSQRLFFSSSPLSRFSLGIIVQLWVFELREKNVLSFVHFVSQT